MPPIRGLTPDRAARSLPRPDRRSAFVFRETAFPAQTPMQSHLRPLDTGEILDGAFRLYRRHPGAFAAAGALPLLPVMIVWVWIAAGALRGAAYAPADADLLVALAVLGGWLPATLTRAAVIRMTDDALAGRPVRPRAALGAAVRRLPGAAWAGAGGALLVALPFYAGVRLTTVLLDGGWAAGACVAALLALAFPAALAAPWFGTLQAVVLEGAGGHGARVRSGSLAGRAPRRVALVWAVGFIFTWMPRLACAAAVVVAGTLLAEGAQPVAWLALCQLAGVASTPLVAAMRTLLFNDLRVRTEALDVRVMAERLAMA